MKTFKRVKIFNDRYPLIGPAFWLLSVQYYVTQLVVALAWANHYSWAQNTISDLGNTVCDSYGGRYVCSPGHDWMNASFILLGATMIAGSTLIYQEFRKSQASQIGFSLMALAGLGTILVGIFPENTTVYMHEVGAAQPFIFGNVALIVLGLALDLPQWLRNFSVTLGAAALTALVFFVAQNYLGLGIGGLERIVAYPQSIWLMVFGFYMSRNHYRRKKSKAQS